MQAKSKQIIIADICAYFKAHLLFIQVLNVSNYKMNFMDSMVNKSTCLIVTAGRQSFSSSKSDKHTVPDGYTLGWNRGGSNLPATSTTL